MTKKIKVMLVTHIGFPWGGPTQRYFDLLNSSLSQKIDISFFESSPNKKSFSGAGSVNTENILSFITMSSNYIKSIFFSKPDLVHIASAYGYSFLKHSLLILIAKLFRKKVVFAPHCSISMFIPKARILNSWMKFILNHCDGIIIFSSEWKSLRNIVNSPKIILLKNAINLKNYLEIERPRINYNRKVNIIYLGHIGTEKGILDLINAVKILVDRGLIEFKIELFGENLLSGELNKSIMLVSNLNLENHIFFSSPVFDQEKVEVFQSADIYVLPSHHEGLPISIIEAMAAGLPIVATDVGGIPDLVENYKNGVLVTVNNPEHLAEGISFLIMNESLRREYGLEGRRKVIDEHDVEKYVNKLINFYQEIFS